MSLLVLRLSALGDVIHTLPAVVLLRESLPGEEIVWAVEEPYRDLVEIAGGVRTVPVRMKKWGRSPIAHRRDIGWAWHSLRGSRASVDFQGLVKSAVLGRLSRARLRFGFDRLAVREPAALLFTNRRVSVDRSSHVVEQNLELARAVVRDLGGSPSQTWRAGFEQGIRRFAEGGKLGGHAGSIVLLPGAGKPNKIWPVERFRELARAIGPRALTAWGPTERTLAEAVGAPMAPPTNLRELASLLASASVVVGGDTGPLHLAAALGTKVVGLYGPTDPCRNGPWGQIEHCVDRFHATKLIDSISVEDVVRKIEEVNTE